MPVLDDDQMMCNSRRLLLLIAFSALILAVDSASACPMCKAAAESDPKLPNAFLASILFMLAMPFTLVTCFGVAFYRLSRKSDSAQSDYEEYADNF